jgi:hypothetical protein
VSSERGLGGPLTAYRLPLTCWLVMGVGACNVTPLTNRIAVGEDAFVIGVGEGPDSLTDLFAAPAGGGNFVRLTFNRAEERGPRLGPDGTRVAYLRRSIGSPVWSLVILDLQNNAEQSEPLPAGAGEPLELGWGEAGKTVIVHAGGYFSTEAPPAPVQLVPVGSGALAAAASATRERLGPGDEGVVRSCGTELCVVVGDSVTPLGAGRTGAIRWGADSIGYFADEAFEVRPLGGGHPRRPAWKDLPARLRQLSYHAGAQVTTRTGVSGRR